jgi:hypothetical protein
MKITHSISLIVSISCITTPTACYHKIIKKKLIVSYAKRLHARTPTHPSNPPITIWIHGTRFIRRPMYESFFEGTPHLKLAKYAPEEYYLRTIAQTLSKTDPIRFPFQTFYLFGWSGKLRAAAREEAAKYLYRDLTHLAIAYEKRYHKRPIIRIITHSHGGTVALNIAKVQSSPSFHIKELILLACPVQKNTREYLADPLFEKVYALCSSLDMVQLLAPQIISNVYRTKKGNLRSKMEWPLFSERCFPGNPKLTQIKIKMNGRAIFHHEFNGKPFIRVLPRILTTMNSWKNEHWCNENGAYLLCVYTPKPKRLLRKQLAHRLYDSNSVDTRIS